MSIACRYVTYADYYFSETEKGRNGDSAWPLWGLSMRIIQGVNTIEKLYPLAGMGLIAVRWVSTEMVNSGIYHQM